MSSDRVIVVGASHAGAQLCSSLRQEGWTGEIVLLGDEAEPPYHHPPLSKTFLTGNASLEDLLIRAPDFYAKQGITLMTGRVTAIQRETHSLLLADGSSLSYDKLALCVGARPRLLPLPGIGLPGVHLLRTLADLNGIRATLGNTRQAVIIGAGYIGLETAASLRKLGIAVTLLESAERVLARVTAPVVSDFYARIHRQEGVDLRTQASVTALIGDQHVTGVALASGEIIPADLVIVGVGVIANTELAAEAGLTVNNGIVIDAHAVSSDPDIVAAGDCSSFICPRYGRQMRLESVPNANEQAKVAAATLCGKSKRISALPWFWSDQYDLKLQIAGLNTGYNDIELVGDPETGRSFACLYYREQRLIAADCINSPKEFMRAKQAISEQLSVAI